MRINAIRWTECRYVAGAVHWRHWVREELQEVRVTCNEQDVLESQCVMSNPGWEKKTLYCILLCLQHRSFYFLWNIAFQKIIRTPPKKKNISGFMCKKRCCWSVLSGAWQCSRCSRMRWRSPEPTLPSSASHINPAGLCLYGSPAHTSVMRVNKQRAKGQLSPQNKRGHRGERGGRKGERPEAVLRSLSGLQAGNDVRDNSPEPEMIINREQGRVYERKGLHCLYLSNLLLPRIRYWRRNLKKMKRRTTPDW